MVESRPALASDCDAIATLLANSFDRPKEKFLPHLDNAWTHRAPNLGFVLEDSGRVVGFLGALYSEREIGGRGHAFCNMRYWAVSPAFRGHSLKLLKQLLAQPGYTFTNFSASAKVAEILRLLRFKELDTGKVVYSPLSRIRACFGPGRVEVVADADALRPLLGAADQRILDDHRPFGARRCCCNARGRDVSSPC